jgi:hypothetical protein
MNHNSRVSFLFVGLAMLSLAPQCDNKHKTEQQRQAKEAAERAERERMAREEAEKARDEAVRKRHVAEREAATWKTSFQISLAVSVLVVGAWVAYLVSQASNAASGPTPETQKKPLRIRLGILKRRVLIALLTGAAANVGGLIGGSVANETGAALASFGGAVITLVGAYSTNGSV